MGNQFMEESSRASKIARARSGNNFHGKNGRSRLQASATKASLKMTRNNKNNDYWDSEAVDSLNFS